MAKNVGNTVVTLLIGTAIGAAAGYVLGSGKDKRSKQLGRLKKGIDKVKMKTRRKTAAVEEEILNA